jgi:hypothetical protein
MYFGLVDFQIHIFVVLEREEYDTKISEEYHASVIGI